jgi:hypothetical protein
VDAFIPVSLFCGVLSAAEGRHLDDFSVLEMNVSQAESFSDEVSVGETLLDLTRPGVGDDIKILRGDPLMEVLDRRSGQVSDETQFIEAVSDLERIRIDVFF